MELNFNCILFISANTEKKYQEKELAHLKTKVQR